jgi:hypothetical protein
MKQPPGSIGRQSRFHFRIVSICQWRVDCLSGYMAADAHI